MNQLQPFKLERYFAKHEFTAKYLLCCSDCESITTKEVLALQPGSEKAYTELSLMYTEPPGSETYRKAIASIYQGLDKTNIYTTIGGGEAIYAVMRALLKPQDKVIVMTPCYESLFEVPRSLGCDVHKWDLEYNQGWQWNLDTLKEQLSNTKMVVLNAPHNPTGFLPTPQEWEEFFTLAKQHGVYVVCDEVYLGLEFNARSLPVCEQYDNAISIGVLSKAQGLPGLRAGWIATKNKEVITQVAQVKDYLSICSSAPTEFLATIALHHNQKLLDQSKEILHENLKLLNEFFEKHQGTFEWVAPRAGPIAFVGLKKGSSKEFCERLLQEQNTLLLPSEVYDFRDKHFRIGFGRKNMKTSLEKLSQFME